MREMPYFLIVYDRAARAVHVQEFASEKRDEALRARFAAEDAQRSNPNMEVVLLSSTSRQAIERTHARYFETAGQLARPLTG